MVELMAMEYSIGRMEIDMKEDGRQDYNTATLS